MPVDTLENDELLQLKKRARRRLVGAVAFMLVALLVLSLVMESRPADPQPAARVAIDGATPAGPAASAPNPFVAPAGAATDASAAAASGPVPLPPVAKPMVEPDQAALQAAAAARRQAAEQEAAAQKAAAEAARKAAEKKAADKKAAEKKLAEKKAADKKAADKKPAETAADKPASGGGSHTASVAALSDPARAAQLQRKLQAQGLKAYVEPVQVDGKSLTRVRIGPYASRAELEKAKARLAMMGL